MPVRAAAIEVRTEGVVGIVSLARSAKRNAIDGAMIRRIGALFEDPPAEWRAAVLQAQGEHFSAGLDLAEHRARSPEAVMAVSRLWHRATQAVRAGRIPVVAALQGHVIGAGLELAAAAHLRIADPGARFSLPEARRGIFVGGGASVRVGRLIGASRLTEMMLTGREVEAEEALRIGLVHRLSAPGASLADARALAEDVAGNAPLSNQMIIGALEEIADMPQAAGLFTEALAASYVQTDGEAQARMDAFLTRKDRKPRDAG
ncbi:crotonase/enoyl-CoA hydratase family protein [Salinarimonas ramus]|uniref:Enoyl-CoA hydratase n=1 Tax=Salinarimonas ramus TaxID=690164 RepID=A0A917V6P6_9HYPH|nr:crotonase/enoyl-CoA hydratase family protein [Salinarimonas ramus]GGK44086.1 enoyl-CoA hydratase [Salinarimonas ramus]